MKNGEKQSERLRGKENRKRKVSSKCGVLVLLKKKLSIVLEDNFEEF
jgi:hypothetical protein